MKMSDSGTIPEKIMKFGGDAGENEEIRANHRERSGQTRKKGLIRVSTGKGRIPMSAEKVESRRIPKKGSGRVPEMWNPGEYRKRMGS